MTSIADTHSDDAVLGAAAGPAATAEGAARIAPDAAADRPGDDAHGAVPSGIPPSAASAPGAGDGETRQAVIAIPPALEADLRAERDAGETPDVKRRGASARLLDYSAHAAMIVGLIGFAWTVSNHVVSRPTSAETAVPAVSAAKSAEAKPDPVAAELAALKQDNLRLAADLGGLRAQVAAMNAASARAPAQVKGLQTAIDSLQSILAAARSDAATQAIAINARLDRLQRDAALGRPERGSADLTTGSLPPKEARPVLAEAAPLPPAKPEMARPDPAKPEKPEIARTEKVDAPGRDPAKDSDSPPVLSAYVVRDVARGVALIEGRRGMLEVVPGVSIPGAGVVKSIERRGKGWTVITTKGQLAYAAPLPTYRRDGGRDYYPSYRYDF